jgi:hypothetical protein
MTAVLSTSGSMLTSIVPMGVFDESTLTVNISCVDVMCMCVCAC